MKKKSGRRTKQFYPEYTKVSHTPNTVCRSIYSSVFDAPFFNDGVIQARAKDDCSETIDLRDLSFEEKNTLLELKGFIFHTSHCGSTLLAQMLQASSQIRVVSETEAINGLLLSYVMFDLNRKETKAHLKKLIDAYRKPLGSEEYVIFKLSSWNIFFADLFLELYTETPWVYIDRDTKEVVRSFQKSNGGFTSWWDHASDLLRNYFIQPHYIPIDKTDYLKHMVLQHRKQLKHHKNDFCSTLVYPDFLNQFECQILPHFNIKLTEKEIETSLSMRAFDSKTHKKLVFLK